jgi:DNA-binding transcriptional LysR family regulator
MPRGVTLSFELLETFVTFIREGGETAATMERLGLEQPALWKRLRYFQQAGPLLERPWLVCEGKRWALTAEGERVWPATVELVDRYHDLRTFLSGAGSPGPAVVRFACGQQMAGGLVREAFDGFRRQHPDARIRLSTLRGQARIEGVASGALDLALVTFDEAAIRELARRPLHVETLRLDNLALAASSKSSWGRLLRALLPPAPPEVLAHFPLVLPEPDAGIRHGLDAAVRRLGLADRLSIAFEVGGWPTLLAYVRDGFGVGVVSEGALDDRRGLTVRPLDPAAFPPITVRLICRRAGGSAQGLDLSEWGEAWRQTLIRTAGRHP